MRAVGMVGLGSHAEGEARGAEWVAWHQVGEGLSAPSLFSMTAALGCRLSSAWKVGRLFQLQGLLLRKFGSSCMANGNHASASWLIGIVGTEPVLWSYMFLRFVALLGWDPSLRMLRCSCCEVAGCRAEPLIQLYQEVTQENLKAEFQVGLFCWVEDSTAHSCTAVTPWRCWVKVRLQKEWVSGLGLCCWPWYEVFLAQGSNDLNCSSVGVELVAQMSLWMLRTHSTIKDANISSNGPHICRRHWTEDPRNHGRIS